MNKFRNFLSAASEPVDPDVFLWCSRIFFAAAFQHPPADSPSSRPAILEPDGSTVALSDHPLNRGLLAVRNELHLRSLDQTQCLAINFRLMHLEEAFHDESRIGEFIVAAPDGSGNITIADALIKACACARLNVSENSVSWDMDDVVQRAKLLAAEGSRPPAGKPPAPAP